MGLLKSKLFSKPLEDDRLERCLVDDGAHVQAGDKGEFVLKIQIVLDTMLGTELRKLEPEVYGPATARAVQDYKNSKTPKILQPWQTTADPVVGRRTIASLDQDMLEFESRLRGGGLEIPKDKKPNSGSSLAHTDVGLALTKVRAAVAKLQAYQRALANRALGISDPPFDPVTQAALRTHFRLSPSDSTESGPPQRPLTRGDIDHILNHFAKIQNVLTRHQSTFTDGSPVDKKGNIVAAAAHSNSNQIIFSKRYKDFSDADAVMIGPNSRAAILIHEGFHAVDSAKKSGADDVHVSEFSAAYDQQPADKSLFNPSSYASFAAHVVPPGKDPKPRYGLGAGRYQ